MISEFDALYEETRNAVDSWLGYQYQGKYALLRYLECLVEEYEKNKENPVVDNIKVCVEWIEDFIIFKDGKPAEIYQIKKDLNKKNREEVIQNFVLQFKLLKKQNVRWVLGYSTTKLDAASIYCTETEFSNFYENYISHKWLREIGLLERNIKKNSYWHDNLNLRSSKSKCKTIRAYIRTQIDEFGHKDYKTDVIVRQKIRDEILKPLKEKLKKEDDDYTQFNLLFVSEQLDLKSINDRCTDKIKLLMQWSHKDELLTAEEAVALLLYDFGNKMELLKNKKEMFKYELSDLQKIISNKSVSQRKWALFLKDTQDELLRLSNKKYCSKCSTSDNCTQCILHTIPEWNMQELIDNLNLDYPLYSEENAIISYRNKATDQKLNMLLNVLNKFKNGIRIKGTDVLCDLDEAALSVILGSDEEDEDDTEENVNGEIVLNLMENYKAHQKVYRDHAVILTKKFNYILHPRNIDFLEDLPESEIEENPTFFSGRDVEFMHYGKKVKK